MRQGDLNSIGNPQIAKGYGDAENGCPRPLSDLRDHHYSPQNLIRRCCYGEEDTRAFTA
jgi:hypothetical protein